MLGFNTRSKTQKTYPIVPPAISQHNPAHQGGFRKAMTQLSADLIIEMPNGEGRRVKVNQPALIIGRSQMVEITLDTPVVSRQHARIERVGNAYFITDLGSTNGTLVNGAPIGSVQLHNGDLITLGHDSAYPISIVFRVSADDQSVNWLN